MSARAALVGWLALQPAARDSAPAMSNPVPAPARDWPQAEEAIQLELEQVGWNGKDPIVVARQQGEAWWVEVRHDGGRVDRVQGRGRDPEEVALRVIERVRVAPASRPLPPASPPPERPRPWALELGVAITSAPGRLGPRIAIARLWPRWALVLGAEGNVLPKQGRPGPSEVTSAVTGRVWLGVDWQWRPQRVISGRIGVGTEFAFTRFRSAIHMATFDEDIDGLAASWDPTARVSVAWRLHPSVGLQLGVRGGPRVRMGRVHIAGGGELKIDPWLVVGTLGVVIHLPW